MTEPTIVTNASRAEGARFSAVGRSFAVQEWRGSAGGTSSWQPAARTRMRPSTLAISLS